MQDRVIMLNASDFKNGSCFIDKKLPYIKATDTLVVNIARVEKGYYDFVKAQLRSANWLNQLIGEAVNYPSNVKNGLGYFSLHRSDTRVYRMSRFVE
jgi:hypothetical protein